MAQLLKATPSPIFFSGGAEMRNRQIYLDRDERPLALIVDLQERGEIARELLVDGLTGGEAEVTPEGIRVMQMEADPETLSETMPPPVAQKSFGQMCLVNGCYDATKNGPYCGRHKPKPCPDPRMMGRRA